MEIDIRFENGKFSIYAVRDSNYIVAKAVGYTFNGAMQELELKLNKVKCDFLAEGGKDE